MKILMIILTLTMSLSVFATEEPCTILTDATEKGWGTNGGYVTDLDYQFWGFSEVEDLYYGFDRTKVGNLSYGFSTRPGETDSIAEFSWHFDGSVPIRISKHVTIPVYVRAKLVKRYDLDACREITTSVHNHIYYIQKRYLSREVIFSSELRPKHLVFTDVEDISSYALQARDKKVKKAVTEYLDSISARSNGDKPEIEMTVNRSAIFNCSANAKRHYTGVLGRIRTVSVSVTGAVGEGTCLPTVEKALDELNDKVKEDIISTLF